MVEELAGQKGVEILVRSQITALDNQSAYIQIGRRVPFGGAAGGDKFGKIQFQDVGLTLGVTPRINPDGVVTMEIDFEKSDLKDAAGNESAPPIDTIQVQTTVSVADGRTLVLGGLVAEAGNDKRELLIVVTPHIVTAN
jgi:type II secretory pathway component GspD/PulD (secretin)